MTIIRGRDGDELEINPVSTSKGERLLMIQLTEKAVGGTSMATIGKRGVLKLQKAIEEYLRETEAA